MLQHPNKEPGTKGLRSPRTECNHPNVFLDDYNLAKPYGYAEADFAAAEFAALFADRSVEST